MYSVRALHTCDLVNGLAAAISGLVRFLPEGVQHNHDRLATWFQVTVHVTVCHLAQIEACPVPSSILDPTYGARKPHLLDERETRASS